METRECASLDMTRPGACVEVHSLDRGLLECTCGELKWGTPTCEYMLSQAFQRWIPSGRLILSDRET